jgi:hypothetical protein
MKAIAVQRNGAKRCTRTSATKRPIASARIWAAMETSKVMPRAPRMSPPRSKTTDQSKW